SPGGCEQIKRGKISYCKKHEMPCRNGCAGWYHLINQKGCQSCETAWKAKARQEKRAIEQKMIGEKGKLDDAFWNPAKDRKKVK
ncbi:hypothetical protein T440DRAFT_403103, partial [Plenodomus tracheiphilus IPT5]